jgi:hypothetical protein
MKKASRITARSPVRARRRSKNEEVTTIEKSPQPRPIRTCAIGHAFEHSISAAHWKLFAEITLDRKF